MLYCLTKVIGFHAEKVKTISVRKIRGCGERRKKKRRNGEWLRERERDSERASTSELRLSASREGAQWASYGLTSRAGPKHSSSSSSRRLSRDALRTFWTLLEGRVLLPPAPRIFDLKGWFRTKNCFKKDFWNPNSGSSLRLNWLVRTHSRYWGKSSSCAGTLLKQHVGGAEPRLPAGQLVSVWRLWVHQREKRQHGEKGGGKVEEKFVHPNNGGIFVEFWGLAGGMLSGLSFLPTTKPSSGHNSLHRV